VQQRDSGKITVMFAAKFPDKVQNCCSKSCGYARGKLLDILRQTQRKISRLYSWKNSWQNVLKYSWQSHSKHAEKARQSRGKISRLASVYREFAATFSEPFAEQISRQISQQTDEYSVVGSHNFYY
jgi:hypothetical protein